jgi:hypothetical protein
MLFTNRALARSIIAAAVFLAFFVMLFPQAHAEGRHHHARHTHFTYPFGRHSRRQAEASQAAGITVFGDRTIDAPGNIDPVAPARPQGRREAWQRPIGHQRLARHPAASRPHYARAGIPLVTVPTAAGIDITVSPSFAPKIRPFIAALVERGYRPRHIGCFATGGHVQNSLHYSGNACDFDQRGWGLTVAAMYHVGDLAAQFGLRNGCSFGDCGHIDSGRGALPRNPFFPVGWKGFERPISEPRM